MKPFKIDDREYNTLEEVKRELLVETIDGCLYMMFLHQPSATESTVNSALNGYARRLSLFADNLYHPNETSEEAQVTTHLENLINYLHGNKVNPETFETKRREITQYIVDEIAPIARGLERKTGEEEKVRDSYNEKFLRDYVERLLTK